MATASMTDEQSGDDEMKPYRSLEARKQTISAQPRAINQNPKPFKNVTCRGIYQES